MPTVLHSGGGQRVTLYAGSPGEPIVVDSEWPGIDGADGVVGTIQKTGGRWWARNIHDRVVGEARLQRDAVRLLVPAFCVPVTGRRGRDQDGPPQAPRPAGPGNR